MLKGEVTADKDGRRADVAGKKAYKTPHLTKHGSVAQLTAGVNGSNFDPGHNNNTRRGGG
jgi:hypothetical protein